MTPNYRDSSGLKAYDNSKISKRHCKGLIMTGPPEWLSTRDKLISQFGRGFLIALVGQRGPGKTQLAQQLIMYAAASGRYPTYVRAMTLIVELQTANTSLARETRQDVIERYTVPDLLVIDEFQERGETDFENRMLNHIIDVRYGDLKDTLLIANLTPRALHESVGESIADRIRETGGVIECTWGSFRRSASGKVSGDVQEGLGGR